MRRAHANEIDTIEAGAYAIALVLADGELGLVAVVRAPTKSGADWYLKAFDEEEADAYPPDLEDAFRLEVSGVGNGSLADVFRRLTVKVEQAKNGESNIPALAGVVGFRTRHVVFEKVQLV